MSGNDVIKWHAHARVEKYSPEQVRQLTEFLGYEPKHADFVRLSVDPDEITEADGNLLTTAGLNRVTNLIIGGGLQALTNSRMAVGVGDTATAAAITDAALGGNSSTHSWWQAPDATYPTQANGVLTAYSTFGINDGNFAWAEWGWGIATAAVSANAIFNTATTTGVLLNHKVQALGTKVSGAIWVHQGTVTFS